MASSDKAPPEATASELAGVPLTPRADHLLTLEFGDRKDFDDPRQEWRRLFSELLGTFMLVLVAAGGDCSTRRGRSACPPPWWRRA